jgi:hypothetical protein
MEYHLRVLPVELEQQLGFLLPARSCGTLPSYLLF